MSFINWGHESPEQREIRRKMDERMMFEQVSYNMAMTAAISAGGSLDPLRGLFGVGSDGLIYTVDRSEANWSFNFDNFPEYTVIALNTDDDCLYATVDFIGEVYFMRIDKKTRELTLFENNISDYVTKGSSSLYYEGDGNFIYLDNATKKSTVTSIIRVTLGESELVPVTVTEVSEVDSSETGYLLRNLFLYDGTPWAVAYSGPDIIIGPFDIVGGGFVYSNVLAPSPNETRVEEILSIFSTIEHRGTVYAAIVFSDSKLEGSSNIGLFKVDTETGGALAPYHISFIKDLILDGHEGTAITSIFSY